MKKLLPLLALALVGTAHADSLTMYGVLPVTAGGTGVTTSTGSGSVVLNTSPTFAGTVTAPTFAATAMARVLATNTSAQSIPNNAPTTVTGWTTTFDANSNFVASTGVFTAPATGYYLVTSQLTYNGSLAVGTFINVSITANGAARAIGSYGSDSITTAANSVSASALVQANAGQTITIAATQNSGAAVPLSTNAAFTYLSITQQP